MRQRFIIFLSIFLTVSISWIFQSEEVLSDTKYIILEDFQRYDEKSFPDWNFTRNYAKASSVYSIVNENGKKFLKGSTVNAHYTVQLGKQVNENNLIGKNKTNWDIYAYPFINWEWRIKILPTGGNETYEDTNDSAASIYVVFQKAIVPFASWKHQPANWIKYVWSSTLPTGTVISRKFSKFGMSLYEGRYIVVASGNKDLGKWITFKRNVLEDYKTQFGGNPPHNPIIIGIMTDSNTTKSDAEADYDNIKASKN
jgi:hypothetical protein